MLTTLGKLQEARAVLVLAGHIKHHMVSDDGRCALGAAAIDASGNSRPRSEWQDVADALFAALPAAPTPFAEAFAEYAKGATEYLPSYHRYCVSRYNDRDDTTEADVLALYDRAIAAEVARGAEREPVLVGTRDG